MPPPGDKERDPPADRWRLWYEDVEDVDAEDDEEDEGFRGIAPRQPLVEQLQLLLWCARLLRLLILLLLLLQPFLDEEAIEEQEATDADLIEELTPPAPVDDALRPLIDEPEDMADALEQFETPEREERGW